MTDQEEREECAKFLLDEENWPLYPFCPVKRRREGGGFPDLAVVVARNNPNGRFVVYHKSIYSEPTADTPTTEYATVGDLLDSGWVVD